MKKLLSCTIILLLSIITATGQGSENSQYFNGTNKIIYINSNADVDFSGWDDFTVSAWVYHTNSGGFRTIFDKTVNIGDSDKFNIHIDISPANNVRFNLSKEDFPWEELISVSTIPANTWTHVACVKELNTTTIYINGIQDNTMTITDAFTGTSNAGVNINIGRLRRNGTMYYVGNMDEITLFRAALTQDEIREWMCRGINDTHPEWTNLASYLKLDETGGWTANDSGPGVNHGYGISAPIWETSGAPIGDTSIYDYPADWTGQTMTLTTTAGDELSISDVTGAGSSGAHLYYIGQDPNSTTGITLVGPTNSYYGVFLTDVSGDYTVEYNYADFTTECELCDPLYARNDNAESTWVPVTATHTGCTATANNESADDYQHRSEYYISIQDEDIDLGPDQQFCDGNSTVLDATHVLSTYLWNDASTNATLTVTTTGTYDVSVSYEGCTMQDTIDVTVFANPTVTMSSTDVNCFGGSDGTITGTAAGGTSPYTYNWDSGETTSTVNNVIAGTYVITVTDDNSCTVTDAVTVNEPPTAVSATIASTDVLCNGDLTGDATVTASGGTPGYTYLWSTGGTTDTETGLAAGIYDVTVTDANLCTFTVGVTITEPTALSTTISGNDISCNGFTDGDATVIVSGGVGPYGYLWSSGGTTDTETGLGAGAYSVTITDANGCTIEDNITLTQPQPLSLTMSMTPVSCNLGSDGEASVVVAGGTAPYNYLWSSGGGTDTETGLTAGTYTVTVTDDNGCTAEDNITVTEPTALVLTMSSTDVLCNGGNDGTASVSVSGGTLSYSYTWSSGGTTDSETGLIAGSYTVTITDGNGCTADNSVVVNEPTALAATTSQTDILCNGDATGDASVSVSGGTPGYTYSWSSGGTTDTETGLIAGTYTVTIADANLCTLITSVTITEPAALATTISGIDPTCNGFTDGDATVVVSGGVGPYGYVWSSGGTSDTETGLGVGTYTVTVTDANGCTISDNITLTQPQPLASTMSSTDVSCNGGNDGTATASIAGGTSPYNYSWDTGGTSATETGLIAGIYFITVTDDNGCTISDNITVNEPTAIVLTMSGTDISCNGYTDGEASVSVSGGTPGYNYSWSSGGSTDTETGLAAGTYTVTVTDANSCTVENSIVLTEPPALTHTTSQVDILCHGESTGSATITVAGGVPPYTYTWDSGGSTDTETGLSVGTYNVTAVDDVGCFLIETFTLTEPDTLGASMATLDANCGNADGEATVTVTGGVAPYTYLWDAVAGSQTTSTATGLLSGTYDLTITDDNGCVYEISASISEIGAPIIAIDSIAHNLCNGDTDGYIELEITSGGTPPYTYLWSGGETTNIISGLAAGTYDVTVEDDNGCQTLESYAITEPTLLTSSITDQNDLTCYGEMNGSATVTPVGGTTPYSYLWSNSIATTDSTCTGLSGGWYFVTITDANGCIKIDSVDIFEPTELILSSSSTPENCGYGDGTATITPSGGTPDYTYLWETAATDSTITGLSTGYYFVTVTDNYGCEQIDSVFVDLEGEGDLTVSLLSGIKCYNEASGSIAAAITGGLPPYVFSWSNGSNIDTLTLLTAGVYTVTVTDDNGCALVDSIEITQPDELQIDINITDALCNGDSTGMMEAIVTGGTPPYTYEWDNGQTDSIATNLYAGGYLLTVTDANDCERIRTNIAVFQPPVISTDITVSDPECYGASTGTAEVTASGGTPPYTYLWENGDTNSLAIGIPSGEILVTVLDSNLCEAIDTATLMDAEMIVITTEDITHISCAEMEDGFINIEGSGGAGLLDYIWSNGETSEDIGDLAAGDYFVTATDDNGCEVYDTITINGSETSCYDLEIPTAFTPNYDQVNDTWAIKDVESVDKVEIEIYNRWGQLMFSFSGTGEEYADQTKQWNGTYNGSDVPLGSYVFILKLNDDEPINGVVTIIR